MNWFGRTFAFASMLAICAGCRTPDPAPVLPPAPTNAAPIMRAVVAGLTAVEPGAYDGWDGDCPGADVDAECWALLLRESGFDVAEYHNAQATRKGLIAAARQAWDGMRPGDILVIFISGHGGQDRDADGDESDGQDETLCLWDGALSDDVLRKLWGEVPAGVRIFFVADTCNSGTSFKLRPRSIRNAVPRGFSGALLHFGGCADGKSAYGGYSGGQWTTALIDAWNPALTYREWFDAAAALMPRNQTPQMAEYGVSGFANRKALK